MALRFWLAGVALLLLGEPSRALPSGTERPPGLGSSSHSVHYFCTGVSESNQGLPRYIAVGYVDGQLFNHYDSITRRVQPRAPWMEKMMEEEDPEYWERNTQIEQANEQVFRENLAILQDRYNHSGGFHTRQRMYSCELGADGSKRGHMQYAYDGRDHLALDTETLTWTAANSKAQITKEKWEKEPAFAQGTKAYLEGICIEWLQRYLDYGKESLLRREPPVGKVTHMFLSEGREMLVCQAHGFYPKEIEATWRKGGEILEQDTFRRNVAPNADGTYHAWLSIEINPEDRDLYRCHIDHTGLTEPLVLAWEAPGGHLWPIVGIVLGVLVALLLVAAGIVFFRRKQEEKAKYSTAPTNDQSSDGSAKA
uniref:Class I histocompatibility antigen, F10 alpha chain-like n=1 Tax=Pogona vitticeps TaxID=103695 RepID=A0ABM5FF03_9SAUR